MININLVGNCDTDESSADEGRVKGRLTQERSPVRPEQFFRCPRQEKPQQLPIDGRGPVPESPSDVTDDTLTEKGAVSPGSETAPSLSSTSTSDLSSHTRQSKPDPTGYIDVEAQFAAKEKLLTETMENFQNFDGEASKIRKNLRLLLREYS